MRVFTLFAFLLCSLTLVAQDHISGAELIARLDKGEDIALTGATITGDLDFTQLADREEESKGKWDNQKAYRTHVRNRISFADCTFEGNVIGYYSKEDNWGNGNSKEPLVNTDFHEMVAFTNCNFKEKALFKYSRFDERASFAGSKFAEGVNFKYTNFDESVNFAGVEIRRDANFKYTDFDEGSDFSGANFYGDADFKYTKFPRGSSLANATFHDDANFKYTEFHEDTNLAGTDFGRDTDFKYTKKGGRSYRPGR